MNIFQINTLDTKGGAAKVAYQLQKELAERGHEINYLVSKKYSNDPNIHLVRPYNNLRQRIHKKLSYYLANDIDLSRSDHILKTAEFQNADIVHCHNLHGNYFNLKTLMKISAVKPIVWTFHDMWPITPHCAHAFGGQAENGFFQCPNLDIYPPIAWHNEKYLTWRKRNIYKKSDFHIVTPSSWLKNKVKESILKDRPVSVIHNGVDINIFKPYNQQLAREELGLSQNGKIVLFLAKGGEKNPWKGGSYVSQIIKRTRNSKIVFLNLGGEPNKSTDNIKYVGYIADANLLAKYYSAADILLYPSIADNCPLVVLEAQACGLPIIAFKTGGIPEIIEHKKTGYVAEYKNINDLHSGLNWLLEQNHNDYETIKQNSIQRIQNMFTLDLMINKYLQLYSQILESKNPFQ